MTETPQLGARYAKRGVFHDWLKGERLAAREAIESDFLSTARWAETQCLCGGMHDIRLSSIDRYGFCVKIVLCKQCGLVRLNPRWDPDTYTNIYKAHYWPLVRGTREITPGRFNLSVKRAKDSIAMLRHLVDIGGRSVLEIGCSYGAALSLIRQNHPKSVIGYDYDIDMLEFGRNYAKIDLRVGGIDEALHDGVKADIVILRHVVEHLLNPFDELESIRGLLSDRGCLFIEIPGLLSRFWTSDLLMYWDAFHTYSYCMETLQDLMKKCGFYLQYGNQFSYSMWSASRRRTGNSTPSQKVAKKVLLALKRREAERRLRQRFVGIAQNVKNVIIRTKMAFR